MATYQTLAILYDMCIDSSYTGKSTCTTAFADTAALRCLMPESIL